MRLWFRVSAAIAVAAISILPVRANAADPNEAFAQERYAHALQLYERADYEAALDEFRASLEIYASPNARLFVARCLKRLGRAAEAVLEYERTAAEARDRAQTDPRYQRTESAARSELAEIADRVGRLILHIDRAPEGTRIEIAGREVPLAALGLPVPVMPGVLEIRAEAPGYAVVQRTVEIAPGQKTSVEIALTALPAPVAPAERARDPKPPPLESPSRSRWPVWAAFGAGGAGLVTAGVASLLASSRYSALQAACGSGPCADASHESDINAGERLDAIRAVALAVALLGAALGTVLIVVDQDGGRP